MKVKAVVGSRSEVPKYKTKGAAGCDVHAATMENAIITIPNGERKTISTGIKIKIPEGYEVQVRPRSGLAVGSGVTVLNSPGTIDCDYTGEIKVILINHGTRPFKIANGDRIGQLVLNKVEQMEFEIVESLEETERGEGGLGHTGRN